MSSKIIHFVLYFLLLCLFNCSISLAVENIDNLRERAAGGDAISQSMLGDIYYLGTGISKDYKVAFKWYKLAADQGEIVAQFSLGGMYYFGDGVSKDYKEARKWYRLAAERGHSGAQYFLGNIYLYGYEVPQDYKEAMKWFLLAAEKGVSLAQYSLGCLYYYGKGVTQNYHEAIKWFLLAAEKGSDIAQYNVGLMYFNGTGVAQDYNDAVKWYRLAAENGNNDAQCTLGFMYANVIVPHDYQEAFKWLSMAAVQGNPQAQYNLGKMYAKGLGMEANRSEAVKWYRLSAEHGNISAINEVANIYKNGEGLPLDFKEAIKWYRIAAENGSILAINNLGIMHQMGQGVAQNYKEALKFFHMAADMGFDIAQYNLAVMHYNGLGVPKDHIEAYMWFNLAASQGNTDAVKSRDAIEKIMSPEQVAEGQRRSAVFVPKSSSQANVTSRLPGIQPQQAITTPKLTGTGYFVSRDGYLLTAAHVVSEASSINVLHSGRRLPARIVRVDQANDVALLRVEGTFSALPITESRAVKLGKQVFTVGFPNIGLQGVSPKLTKGEISSLSGIQDDPRHFQVSVPIQPGNSGGPLVDMTGNVLGMLVHKLDDIKTAKITGTLPQQVNYALKSAYILPVLESIPELTGKLIEPRGKKNLPFEELVRKVEAAVCLILAY